MKLLNQVVNTFATSNLAFLRQTVNRVKENSAHFKIMKRKFPVFSPGIFGLSHCFHYHTQQWVSLRGALISVSFCNRHIIACCCYFCRSRPSSTPLPPFLDFLPLEDFLLPSCCVVLRRETVGCLSFPIILPVPLPHLLMLLLLIAPICQAIKKVRRKG